MNPINLHELEALARDQLPKMVYDYFAGGADDEVTLRRNREAFELIRLRPRVLRGVGPRDLSTTVLGQTLTSPILVAPMGFQGLAHPDGETATAKGAGKADTVMVVSTLANSTLEDVAAAATAPLWFQLYLYRDRGVSEALVRRAEAAGYRALVMTVDVPVIGNRERDVRNNFRLPPGMELANFRDVGLEELGQSDGSNLVEYAATQFERSLSWEDVEWLRSITSLPIVLKGIMHPDDAREAAEQGVGGIVVSNHGARQLDGSPATVKTLPDVVAAVQGKLDVMVDGGIRRGTDVVKALALGARAVLLGRPVLWGLALGGSGGVTLSIEMLKEDLDRTMALCGFGSIGELHEGGEDLLYGSEEGNLVTGGLVARSLERLHLKRSETQG